MPGDESRDDPFKDKKFEFASTAGVDMFQTIAEDFMKRIFGFAPGDYLITDESNLFDFENQPLFKDKTGYLSESELKRRVKAEFGLTVTDFESGNLLGLFRRIHRGETDISSR